jgi:hypothetical protein
MISYIWPDSVGPSTMRTRKQTLRKALIEIVTTGAWEVEPGYVIKRNGNFKKKKIAKKIA